MARRTAKEVRWLIALALVAALAAPGARAGSVVKEPLAAGETVQPFDAAGLDGVMKHIDFPKGSSTVLLFFLSGCPTCHKMIPEWNLAYEKKPPKLNVIGVIMDQEPPGFFEATKIPFPVVRSPGRDFLLAWKVQRAPMTVRVAAGGKVEEAQIGIIDPIRLGEIFRP
jgi:thiol-disulfide isomerase/thioredoxin